ncbi:MAG: GAF domain-containing protein [Dehalococcoidia bacterium]|nr:GAF domain-containing protein [Dehalococcoidia bacterium]
MRAALPSPRLSLLRRDPETRALRALAQALRRLPPRHRPDEALQVVVDLAQRLTAARYGALAVTDEHDRTVGFVTAGLSEQELRGLRAPPQGHGPLGALRADGRPVRYDDVQQHARAFGFPRRHPRMQALLGVPIWARGVVRGSLYVTDRAGGRPFSGGDERVLLTLAGHASKVIEIEWY